MEHDLTDYRYLVLAQGRFGPQTSKTANSAVRYLPERVAAVVDPAQAGRTVQQVSGSAGRSRWSPRWRKGWRWGPRRCWSA